MDDHDLLHWTQVSPGVGEAGVGDLLAFSQVPAPVPLDPRTKPVRRRPNKGRKKRTDRNPPLSEPPWELLVELGVPFRDIENLPTTPTNWRRGPKYLVWKARVFELWGTTCHLCGHPEAHSADHLVPVSVWPNQPYDPRLAKPAHGVVQPDGSEGCPTCHAKCNSSRGNRALAAQIANYQPAVQL